MRADRIPMIDGDEVDVFHKTPYTDSGWRHTKRAVKRSYNKRVRRLAKLETNQKAEH